MTTRKTSIIVTRKSVAQRIRLRLRNANLSSYISTEGRGDHEVYLFVPDGWDYAKADDLLRTIYREVA